MNLFEDDRPRKPSTAQPGEKLDDLSVGDLEERIQVYRSEIERLQREVEAKKKSMAAADSVFRR
jgi:uncharacterized small protein (DUF1192 family)